MLKMDSVNYSILHWDGIKYSILHWDGVKYLKLDKSTGSKKKKVNKVGIFMQDFF